MRDVAWRSAAPRSIGEMRAPPRDWWNSGKNTASKPAASAAWTSSTISSQSWSSSSPTTWIGRTTPNFTSDQNSRSLAPVGSTSSRSTRSSSAVGCRRHRRLAVSAAGGRQKLEPGRLLDGVELDTGMQRPHPHLLRLGLEVEHAEIGHQQLRSAGKPEPGPVIAAVAPADARPEVELVDERPRVVGRAPQVDVGDHARQVGHAPAAGQPDLGLGERADDRVVHVAVPVHLGAAEGERVVAGALGVGPEVERRVRDHGRPAPQRVRQRRLGDGRRRGVDGDRAGRPHQLGGVGPPGEQVGAHRDERHRPVERPGVVGELVRQGDDDELVDRAVVAGNRRCGSGRAHRVPPASSTSTRAPPLALMNAPCESGPATRSSQNRFHSNGSRTEAL